MTLKNRFTKIPAWKMFNFVKTELNRLASKRQQDFGSLRAYTDS